MEVVEQVRHTKQVRWLRRDRWLRWVGQVRQECKAYKQVKCQRKF